MGCKLNRASWRSFDVMFQPWMRRRLRVCMGSVPQGLPADRPVLLVSNHVSWWDGFLLRTIQQAIRPGSPLYTVALERELVLHPILRLLGGVGLSPSSPGSILHALRVLARTCTECPDTVLGYFPQGCITPSFRRPLGFTRGVDLFVRRLAPLTVLPVALHIEPLTAIAPTAFILIGTPRSTDSGANDSAALERAVTQLLDTALATLALHGEGAAEAWHDAHGLHPVVDQERPIARASAAPRAASGPDRYTARLPMVLPRVPGRSSSPGAAS